MEQISPGKERLRKSAQFFRRISSTTGAVQPPSKAILRIMWIGTEYSLNYSLRKAFSRRDT